MPTYDYRCEDCGHEFEHFQSMLEDPLKICPVCKGRIKRLIGPGSGLIFKGSGFYITDYKKKETAVQGPVKKKESTESSSSAKKEKSSKVETSSKKSDSSKDSK